MSPREKRACVQQKCVHDTQSSFIPNSPTPETLTLIQKSTGTQAVVHPRRGILYSDKKEQTVNTPNNMDASQILSTRCPHHMPLFP